MNDTPINNSSKQLKVQICGVCGNELAKPILTTDNGQLITTLYDSGGNPINSTNNSQLNVTLYDAEGNPIKTINNGQAKTTMYKSDGTEMGIETYGEVKVTMYTGTGQAIETVGNGQVVITVKSSDGTELAMENTGEVKTSLYGDKNNVLTKLELNDDNRLKVAISDGISAIIEEQNLPSVSEDTVIINTTFHVSNITKYAYYLRITNISSNKAKGRFGLEISPDDYIWVDGSSRKNISINSGESKDIILVSKYYSNYVRLYYKSNKAITVSGFVQGI